MQSVAPTSRYPSLQVQVSEVFRVELKHAVQLVASIEHSWQELEHSIVREVEKGIKLIKRGRDGLCYFPGEPGTVS